MPQLPEGYAAVAVSAEQCAATLQICAVVRLKADPVGGHLVVLRETLDARVVLGCIAEAGGRIHQWVELWIQNLDGLAGSVSACREALSNAALDDRWTRHFKALEQIEQSEIIRTGWETVHPVPVFLDLSTRKPVHPAAPGGQWKLCEDGGLLARAGLPEYAASLHRYLYVKGNEAKTAFVPVTPDAPTGPATMSLGEAIPDAEKLVPLNPAGGLMLVRGYYPIGLEDFINLLNGGQCDGIRHGRSLLGLVAGKPSDDDDRAGDGRFFLGKQGRCGRFVETFYLKLRLLAEVTKAVREQIGRQQRPLLNITPASFQLKVDCVAQGLPFLWTARAVLADPGDAVALPIKTSDAQYYLRATTGGTSIYFPSRVSVAIGGRGTVRIRQVLPDTSDTTILEGTFVTQERLDVAAHDLIWLRLSLPSGRVDLYARLQQGAALAAGEWRFRTIGHRFGKDVQAALRAAEGLPLDNVQFEVIPLLSTPCDLYSLGVVAARTLLVDDKMSLPVAMDELMSLAGQLASEHDPSVEPGARIRAIFERDERWKKSLGPQRLTFDDLTPDEAFAYVPPELWFDTLAVLVRPFAGIGPDSECRDLGAAPAGAVQQVFDRNLAGFENILLRTRSLILIDWNYNREIDSVIREYMKKT